MPTKTLLASHKPKVVRVMSQGSSAHLYILNTAHWVSPDYNATRTQIAIATFSGLNASLISDRNKVGLSQEIQKNGDFHPVFI